MSKKRAHSAVEPAQQPQQTQQQAPTEYSLPKRLAHNDKAIRDGAIAALVKWLDRAEDISELDMMKLWKGLFYCFWMSDKEAVQEELAGNMANILQQVQPERGMLYLDCFFKTLRREWEGLDRLRMDKFMRLVRKFVFSAFRLLQRSDWDPLLGVWITSIIGTDLFEAKNRGLLMHMSDVVLQELVRVHSDEPVVTPLPTPPAKSGGKKKKKKNNQPEPEPEPEKDEDDEDGAGVIDALSLQRLLAPFYLLLGESKDVALSKRVSEGVFEALIAVVKQDAKEGEEDHVLRPTVLQLLPTMSDKLFQLASAPNILDSVRNRLYPLRMACKEQITRHQLDEKDIFDDHFEEEGEDEGDEGDFEGDEFDEFDFEGDEGDDQFDFGDFEGDEGEEGEEEEEEAPQLVPVATEKTVPLPRRSSPIVLPQATGKAAKASKAATTTAKPTTKTIQPTTQAVEQPTPKTTKKKAPAVSTPQPPPTPPTPQQTTTTKKSKKKAIATPPPPPPPPPTPTTTTGKAAKAKTAKATTSPKATTNNNNNNTAQTPATTKKAKAVAPTQATPPPPATTKTAVTGKRKNETAPSPSPAKTQQTPAKGRAKKQ